MNISLKPESDGMLHLDALRFFAACAVVAWHWSASIQLATGSDPREFVRFLTLAVDLFFIISGIVMFNVYFRRMVDGASFLKFMKHRIARLYPLHLATFLIMLAFSAAAFRLHLPIRHPEMFDYRGILPNLFLLQSFPVPYGSTFNFPAWSISAEMVCYTLLPVAFFFCRRLPWLPILLALLGIVILTAHSGLTWTEWAAQYSFLRALPAFLFGIALGRYSSLLKRIPVPHLLLPVSAVLFLASGFLGLSRIFSLLFVYAIVTSAYAADVQKRPSRFIIAVAPLGLLTYSIYMLHIVYQNIAIRFLQVFFHLSRPANNVAVVLSFLPLLVLAYLSYKYFEIPARRWISSFTGFRKTAPSQASPSDIAVSPMQAAVEPSPASLK